MDTLPAPPTASTRPVQCKISTVSAQTSHPSADALAPIAPLPMPHPLLHSSAFAVPSQTKTFTDIDLSGTPTFGSQTASVSSTGTASATGIQTTHTGSAAVSASSGVPGSGSGTVAPSASAASSSGSIVGGNGLFVGFLAVMVGMAVGGMCRLEFG